MQRVQYQKDEVETFARVLATIEQGNSMDKVDATYQYLNRGCKTFLLFLEQHSGQIAGLHQQYLWEQTACIKVSQALEVPQVGEPKPSIQCSNVWGKHLHNTRPNQAIMVLVYYFCLAGLVRVGTMQRPRSSRVISKDGSPEAPDLTNIGLGSPLWGYGSLVL